MYRQKTNNITVSIEPVFMEEESSPDTGRYVWAYHVLIKNDGPKTVQLQERHWKITGSTGFTREITGEGVIGEKPVLQPGGSYAYTSGAPLDTPGGIMVGHYMMKNEEGETFRVDIPAFSLDSPHQDGLVH